VGLGTEICSCLCPDLRYWDRNGTMSSPTVMFVLEEVVRRGDPRPGDFGAMIAPGPGMAAEVALFRW
jgi:predicted naringenin-chalcone synthase